MEKEIYKNKMKKILTEKIEFPYFIENLIGEEIIRDFQKRRYSPGIPITRKEVIEEAENFYKKYF
jgi:hypothetical protein